MTKDMLPRHRTGRAAEGACRRHSSILAAKRDTLRDERGKLLQAHYAGAVPLDLLATEQDRIARRLAFLDAQINADDIEYEQAKAHLEDCLALAGDCHAIYMSIDDSLRRLANQAFFDKLTVTDADTIDGQPGEPFNILFDPDVQRIAVERQHQNTESGRQTGNVVGLNNDHLVELRGLAYLLRSYIARYRSPAGSSQALACSHAARALSGFSPHLT